MEIGILILIILGSFIFKKGNSKEELPQKPVPSKDMTWEEMEEYYGITLSRDPEESVNIESDAAVETTAKRVVITSNPVDVDSYEKSVDSLRYDAEEMRATVHERIEAIPKDSARISVEEVRKDGSSYSRASRDKSLRLTARHGMVWSMILETPKGARMLGPYRR
ncbi:hypothetical protein [Veillonella sp. CHU732]|uniref:hypothetical protein n=1 Tax=Veillonella sp. CHU732 TaxID=2490949 RepID=UPI000F8C90BC|nr:hypothetical protein [Veillonella sp. CHU732]